MAVTTTPRKILTAAYAKSLKNKAGTIATESTELLQVVIRAMRGLYAFAARINPTYFAVQETVAYNAPGWARPQMAESIFRLEQGGNEVVVVPFDDRKAEEGMASVYSFGQVLRPAGNPTDPTLTGMQFFYAKRPSDPANIDATLDALWTESFNELLVLDVGLYLAAKDSGSGREDEVASMKIDRDRWVSLFAGHLEHELTNERRRYGHIRRFNTNALVPLGQLLAGGPVSIPGM